MAVRLDISCLVGLPGLGHWEVGKRIYSTLWVLLLIGLLCFAFAYPSLHLVFRRRLVRTTLDRSTSDFAICMAGGLFDGEARRTAVKIS